MPVWLREPVAQAHDRTGPLVLRRRSKRAGRPSDGLRHGVEYETARLLVWRRCGGRCEICGMAPATDFSHRQTRGVADGGNCPCNGLALCRACHAGRVHDQPAAARDYGWMVSRHAPGGARFEPVWLPNWNGWFQLDCVGGVRSVAAPH